MTQQRRRWTFEEITKLMSMAQKCPPAQIASEIGRAPSFRPHEGPRPVHLFANGSAPSTDTAHGASGLDHTGSSFNVASPRESASAGLFSP